MDIYLTEPITKDRIRFPMLPEQINLQTSSTFESFSILSRGSIKLPTGEELTGISWDGIFPGAVRKNAPYVAEWRDPKELQNLLSDYRINKKKLHLLITETPINYDIYIDSFEVDYSGGQGDYHYKISLFEAKDLIIHQSVSVGLSSSDERAGSSLTDSHTVVQGDTLWGIAQKYYNKGSDYGKVYDANKTIIESEANKRGLGSSDNGRFIFPGTVLTIPQ